MGLFIIWFKWTQVDFRNKYILQSLKTAYIIANSADWWNADYQTTLLGVSSIQRVYTHYQISYAPNFEKVEGAYCFGLVCPCVRPIQV